MAVSSYALHVNGSLHNHSNISNGFNHLKTSVSSIVKPFWKELRQLPMRLDVSKTIKDTSIRILDAFVESTFQIVDQPYHPSQPVEEIGGKVEVICIEGKIPEDFPEGAYIRNGPNPLFGCLKSTVSVFGRTSQIWVEGDGMLHAVYFKKNAKGDWIISYNNRYVESETFKLEKQNEKPLFLPTVEGDSLAVLAASIINKLRLGKVNNYPSNTNVFQHSKKLYAITENHPPQEVDISTLETFGSWDINGAWKGPFTSHPKKAPRSGDLVIMGTNPLKPYYVVGVVSADGKKLKKKVDLKFNRGVLIHDIGATEKYNVILDWPLIFDTKKFLSDGAFLKFEKEEVARIGVMPRYGDADSVKWFEVETNCTFHILNCFEEGDEVVVRGCRALMSIIPGPDKGLNKFEWFSRGFNFTNPVEEFTDCSSQDGFLFAHVYEWRLNMVTWEVKEKNLTGREISMDFPFINENFTGLGHKYGYTQLLDSVASSGSGISKYGGLAKLYLDENQSVLSEGGKYEEVVQVEYHKFGANIFCTGSFFVPKQGAIEEDDGCILTFVHNEETNVSQVYVIDAKRFESEPIAKITLPHRVPYGFHGTFVSLPNQS